MPQKNINLTEAEWSVMECLWEQSPRTGREITQHMETEEGWSRSTTLTLLSRLEAKGAITTDSAATKKTFCPVLRREDAALHETEDFLSRVYHGSVSMLVSSLTKKQALSKEEIRQLHDILDQLEGGSEND